MRGLALLLALTVGWSGPALAVGPSERTAESVSKLFEEGAVLYETADYAGAIDKFARAYGVAQTLDDDELRGKAIGRLLFNLGRAHVQQYGIDRDPVHLRQAVALLKKHADQVTDPIERADGEKVLAEAEGELAKLDQASGVATVGPGVEGCRDRLDCRPHQQCIEGECQWEPAYVAKLEKQSKAFRKAGLPLLVIGVTSTATYITLWLAAAASDASGARGRNMITAGGVLAAIGLPTMAVGIGLVASGNRKRKTLNLIRKDQARIQATPGGVTVRF